MTRKKEITAEKIMELYMNEVLTKDIPKSVYAFASEHKFEESKFYAFYSSFETLEKQIFATFCLKTIELLNADQEYKTYDSKNKLLSFYYTFFELLAANRSYVFLKLKQNKNKLESLKLLSELRKTYIHFIQNEIQTEAFDFKNDKINKFRDKGMLEVAWLQLVFTLQFWLEDESQNFEKTDVFIEKSIKVSFDLKDLTPVQSVFDFAKFLWKEKTTTV
ncbi:TetR family transcriptional regulator C-terminal domain-containing protein [Tenacibaculum sp. TC6]|uniref:TetR family transcriptional regulator C-terminal domain-containing protein n=1 Tax=Tenacibaculum sp. TC6 TaxID=3423223 RepID=UPI003D36FEDC